MKIPNGFQRFEDKSALLIVASNAHAEFYRAKDGNIVKAESFRIGKPKFSDQKSYLSTSSVGGRWKVGTSSLEQLVKRDVLQRFEKTFKEYIKTLTAKDKYDEVYIFSPAHFEGEVEKLLPAIIKKKVVKVIKGNYHKLPLTELLGKISTKPKSKKISGSNIPSISNAKRILSRTSKKRVVQKESSKRIKK